MGERWFTLQGCIMDHAFSLTCLRLSSSFSSYEASLDDFPLHVALLLPLKLWTERRFYSRFLSMVSSAPQDSFDPSTHQTQGRSHCFFPPVWLFSEGALGGITLAATQSFWNNLDMTSGLQHQRTDKAPPASLSALEQRQCMTLKTQCDELHWPLLL